tara:strand:- start:293 stop:829 length:537 start_codon:yes stop_codon:yes gene_type:complete
MYVDKSHSKRDLILLFHNLGIELNNESNKSQIIQTLESNIKNCKYNDKITNCTELIDYLKSPSNKQRPTTKIKSDVMFKCKKIIKWGKNDYIFDGLYKTKDEPYEDIMFIHLWGDLPSVRRACKFYNNSVYCINHINPIISEEVQSQLNNNKIIKQQHLYSLKIRYAKKGEKILVHFD